MFSVNNNGPKIARPIPRAVPGMAVDFERQNQQIINDLKTVKAPDSAHAFIKKYAANSYALQQLINLKFSDTSFAFDKNNIELFFSKESLGTPIRIGMGGNELSFAEFAKATIAVRPIPTQSASSSSSALSSSTATTIPVSAQLTSVENRLYEARARYMALATTMNQYTPVSRGLTCSPSNLIHLNKHDWKHSPSNDPHDTFFKKDTNILALLDEAWQKKENWVESGPETRVVEGDQLLTTYYSIIPMGREIGTNGERYLKIVTYNNQTDPICGLCTAFPVAWRP
jgi:hypothetical protein